MSDTAEGRSLAPLIRQFPYMFAGPHIGISFYRGWLPILSGVCEEIDAALG